MLRLTAPGAPVGRQVKSARRDAQLAQMAERGVVAELDGAEFQAPDLTAPDAEQPQGE